MSKRAAGANRSAQRRNGAKPLYLSLLGIVLSSACASHGRDAGTPAYVKLSFPIAGIAVAGTRDIRVREALELAVGNDRAMRFLICPSQDLKSERLCLCRGQDSFTDCQEPVSGSVFRTPHLEVTIAEPTVVAEIRASNTRVARRYLLVGSGHKEAVDSAPVRYGEAKQLP